MLGVGLIILSKYHGAIPSRSRESARAHGGGRARVNLAIKRAFRRGFKN